MTGSACNESHPRTTDQDANRRQGSLGSRQEPSTNKCRKGQSVAGNDSKSLCQEILSKALGNSVNPAGSIAHACSNCTGGNTARSHPPCARMATRSLWKNEQWRILCAMPSGRPQKGQSVPSPSPTWCSSFSVKNLRPEARTGLQADNC